MTQEGSIWVFASQFSTETNETGETVIDTPSLEVGVLFAFRSLLFVV